MPHPQKPLQKCVKQVAGLDAGPQPQDPVFTEAGVAGEWNGGEKGVSSPSSAPWNGNRQFSIGGDGVAPARGGSGLQFILS